MWAAVDDLGGNAVTNPGPSQDFVLAQSARLASMLVLIAYLFPFWELRTQKVPHVLASCLLDSE